MSRVKNNIKGKNILSIYTGHDSAAVFIDKNNKLKVLEYERFIKQRYGSFTTAHKEVKGIGTSDEQRRKFLQYIRDNAKGEIKVIVIDDPDCCDVNLISEYFPDVKYELVFHHDAHAASGYFTSDFDEAVILSFDGGGACANPLGIIQTEEYHNLYSLLPTYKYNPDTGNSRFIPPKNTKYDTAMTRGYIARGTNISNIHLAPS